MDKVTVKNCMLINCISFTTVMVILSCLSFDADLMTDFTNVFALEVFGCTTMISVLIFFTSRIRFRSVLAIEFTKLLDVAVCVLGLGGGVFGWFPWEGKYILEVCLVFVAVFLVTSALLLWHTSSTANKINKKIKERENDTHH